MHQQPELQVLPPFQLLLDGGIFGRDVALAHGVLVADGRVCCLVRFLTTLPGQRIMTLSWMFSYELNLLRQQVCLRLRKPLFTRLRVLTRLPQLRKTRRDWAASGGEQMKTTVAGLGEPPGNERTMQ